MFWLVKYEVFELSVELVAKILDCSTGSWPLPLKWTYTNMCKTVFPWTSGQGWFWFHPLLTSYCAAWLLMGREILLVPNLGVGDPCYRWHGAAWLRPAQTSWEHWWVCQPCQSFVSILPKWRRKCNRLVVQWVRLCAPNAGGPGLIPGQEARSCMPQLRACTL